MKKLLLALVCIIALQSCTISADEEDAKEMVETFQEVEYKGHSYIVFAYHTVGSYASFSGLTHNPDCPCHKTDSISNGNDTSSIHNE
jgi:hypothetical protein